MKNTFAMVTITLLTAALISCTPLASMEWSPAQLEAKYGTHPPVLIRAFAANEIRPGDPWKIYLSAKDMDGDMRYFMTTFSPSGWVDTYGTVPIPGANKGQISGYLVMYTHLAEDVFNLSGVVVSLEIRIEDMAGHLSSVWTFPLELNYSAREVKPEPGEFKEVSLGTIPAEFPVTGDGPYDMNWAR